MGRYSESSGQELSANYGIISVFDDQYSYSGTCWLNTSPEFRSRFQEIYVSSRLHHTNETEYITCGNMIKYKTLFST